MGYNTIHNRGKGRKLTDKELDQLEKMSAIRLPLEHQAALLDMSVSELEKRIKKNDDVRKRTLAGRAKASNKIRTTLFLRATEEGDFQAIKFWCQTQEGFSTTQNVQLSGPDGKAIESKDVTKQPKEDLVKRYTELRDKIRSEKE